MPEYRDMPLTLAFEPENMSGRSEWTPIVIVQPSAEEAGRIFAGINPVGQPIGCHLLPDEARMIRDHLSKLLLEPEEVAEAGSAAAAMQKAEEPPVDWSERVAQAGQRAKAVKPPKSRWFQFKLEFKIGPTQGLIARTDDT
jgi:hypothetical protein